MARRKETITQVDFSYGSPRKESVEREDTPLVQEGLKEALNTIGLNTGGLEGRPGLVHIGETDAKFGVEVDLGNGRVFDIHVIAEGVTVYDTGGDAVARFDANKWDQLTSKYGMDPFDPAMFWIMPDPETSSVLIGASAYPPHALVLSEDGTWAFGEVEYAQSLSGAILQPYWPYYPDVAITPSARTGNITVTAASPIFRAGHVGTRIRYGGREIALTSAVSQSIMNATVIEELPPTFVFTVASSSGYQLGDAVEHATLGGQGIITGISGNDITVRATALWDGFTSSGKLVGPNASQEISAQADGALAASFQWDMQMGNQVQGYPGWGVKHKGRAFLNSYPSAPNAFAVSVAGRVDDFTLGVDDGDGFVETIGANMGGDLLYIISSEDLLFFTTRGLYYQETRGQNDITPGSIKPVLFSEKGCAKIVPVSVDDGAVFVDAVGSQIHAAVLDGDYYRSWSAINISEYHDQLINDPCHLGATKYGSERPENFVFVSNGDGTAAVCQWDRKQNKVGWRPWQTEGTFLSIYQVLGSIWAVVERTIGGVTARYRERFQDGVYLDCALFMDINASGEPSDTSGKATPTHFQGANPSGYFEGWDLGVLDVDSGGYPVYDFPEYKGTLQYGCPMTIRVTPWPRRSVYTQRGARDVKRSVKMWFSVQDTLTFKFEGYTFGGYRAGDDLTIPPPFRSQEYSAIVGGRRSFEERTLIVDRPGPFRLLKIRNRVTV